MKLAHVLELLGAATTTLASAAAGPCDINNDDANCDRIVDNSGCFLNTSNATRVLGCVDDDPRTARDIVRRRARQRGLHSETKTKIRV